MNKIEKMRKRRVFNPWGFYGRQPFIWYRPRGRDSLSMTTRAWMVTKRVVLLGDRWFDSGSKVFLVFTTSKEETLTQAKVWASKKFGVKEWAKDPFGGYGPKEFMQRRLEEILAVPEGTDMEDRPLKKVTP